MNLTRGLRGKSSPVAKIANSVCDGRRNDGIKGGIVRLGRKKIDYQAKYGLPT